MYRIMCQVSGGVTGFRQGLLKGHDGHPVSFETKSEAQAEVDRITEGINKTRAYGPDFKYWVV